MREICPKAASHSIMEAELRPSSTRGPFGHADPEWSADLRPGGPGRGGRWRGTRAPRLTPTLTVSDQQQRGSPPELPWEDSGWGLQTSVL